MLERSKPRFRAYRPSASAPPVAYFLELKNRADRLVSKDRTPVSRAFAAEILAAPSPESGDAFASDPVLSKFYMLSEAVRASPPGGRPLSAPGVRQHAFPKPSDHPGFGPPGILVGLLGQRALGVPVRVAAEPDRARDQVRPRVAPARAARHRGARPSPSDVLEVRSLCRGKRGSQVQSPAGLPGLRQPFRPLAGGHGLRLSAHAPAPESRNPPPPAAETNSQE